MFIADKQMLANGGSFNGTLAEMITQDPNIYIPQLLGWAKVPLAPSVRAGGGGRGSGRDSTRGGGRESARGGARGGGARGPGTVKSRLGGPVTQEAAASEPNDVCLYCNKQHGPNCYYIR